MSASGVDQAAQFTFCPKCGATLADGRCAKCGWSLPPATPYSVTPRKRRRLEILIGALAFVLLASVGLNLFLNFGSMVAWLPADVLLWMDDGKGDASADLVRRFREGELSDRQLTKLVGHRLSDPRLALRSPFPAGHEQSIQIEQNCRMPLEGLAIRVKDWKLSVDGEEISSAPDESATKPAADGNVMNDDAAPTKKSRTPRANHQVSQAIALRALDEGVHKIELAGNLTVFRSKAPQEVIYARPISVNREAEIKGSLTDYAQPRTDKEMLDLLRNASIAHAWWTGEEDDEYRTYSLSVGAAMPPVPLMMIVSVRVGSEGAFTRVGAFTNRGDRMLISFIDRYSLADVPGIEDARRLQVRMTPDLASAFKDGHTEFFGGIIEWDSVPVHHHAVGHCPNPATDEFRPPTRVRKLGSKKKKPPPKKDDEEV